MEKGNIPLETLAKHFEAYNRSEGKSQQTVLWYSRVLRYFGDYLRGQGLPHTLENLDVGVVREFILYLQTKKKWEGHPCATRRGQPASHKHPDLCPGPEELFRLASQRGLHGRECPRQSQGAKGSSEARGCYQG